MYDLEYRYGPEAMELEDSSIRRRRDGLDAGTINWISQGRLDFAPGGLVPGYGLEIEEVETKQEGETDFMHKMMVVGIYGPRPERRELGFPQIRQTLTGFDEIVDSIITQHPENYAPGVIAAGYANMVCVESPQTHLWQVPGSSTGTWWRVSPHYQGLIDTKPYSRQITCNEEVVSPSEPIIVTLPEGWDDPRKGQISLPKICVRDSRVVIVASDTGAIPGNVTPPDAPDIQFISITGTLTWRWPKGWKIASLDRTEIPGTLIALETISYEYVWPAVFGG